MPQKCNITIRNIEFEGWVYLLYICAFDTTIIAVIYKPYIQFWQSCGYGKLSNVFTPLHFSISLSQ
jgi:hypothetical protein